MKLAEALNERKLLQEKLLRLQERLNANVKIQEGDTPSEEPEALFRELEASVKALEALIVRINRTNAETMVDGTSIADLVAKRDVALKHVRILSQVLLTASERTNRRSAADIRIVSTIDVAARQKEVDLMSKAIRELDGKIQAANWTTDLL